MKLRRALACLVCSFAATAVARAQLPCGYALWTLPNGAQFDRFGEAVAIGASRALVGAPQIDTVRAYELASDGTWRASGALTPSSLPPTSLFGSAIALDGDRAAIGASNAPGGKTCVFEHAAGAWVETAQIAPGFSGSQHFGAAVALHGEWLAVGAPDASLPVLSGGAVYMFHHLPDGTWVETARLTPHQAAFAEKFGTSVALDGRHLLVGAPNGLAPAGTSGGEWAGGLVYTYELEGDEWQPRERLHAQTTQPYEQFGASVAVHGDVAFVGAPHFALTSISHGAVHRLERSSSGAWQVVQKFSALVPSHADRFGASLALVDGALAVGAPAGDFPLSKGGSLHVYREVAGVWQHDLEWGPSSGHAGDEFGLTIGFDGARLVAGAPSYNPGPFGLDKGAAYARSWTPGALDACTSSISLGAGGSQKLVLEAPAQASTYYLVLGSFSGTAPGVAVDGLTLPLNPDAYLDWTVTTPNSALLSTSFGVTSPIGGAQAQLSVPAGAFASLAGATLHHAALTLPLFGAPGVLSVSNAVALQLVP